MGSRCLGAWKVQPHRKFVYHCGKDSRTVPGSAVLGLSMQKLADSLMEQR